MSEAKHNNIKKDECLGPKQELVINYQSYNLQTNNVQSKRLLLANIKCFSALGLSTTRRPMEIDKNI